MKKEKQTQIKNPQFLWAVEDIHSDFEDIKMLH